MLASYSNSENKFQDSYLLNKQTNYNLHFVPVMLPVCVEAKLGTQNSWGNTVYAFLNYNTVSYKITGE